MKKPEINLSFLCVALGRHRHLIFNELVRANLRTHMFLPLAVQGLPVERVVVLCWPDPPGARRLEKIGVDVVQLGNRVLDKPIHLGFRIDRGMMIRDRPLDLWPAEDESEDKQPMPVALGTWIANGIRSVTEPALLSADGEDLYVTVEGPAAAWRMECGCGRVRHASSRTKRAIKRCRICASTKKARAKAWYNFRRAGGNGRRPLSPPPMIGQIWRDNDLRFTKRREVRVLEIAGNHVIVENTKTKKRTRVLLDRFTGRAKGYGFSLVSMS
jgi:hypothetical protein